MSQENVEIVKAVFRGWNEGGVGGMLKFFHGDIEYLPVEEGGMIHGHDAMRRYFERWMEPWEEFQVGPTEFLDAGDYVFNGVALKGRGVVAGSKSRWSIGRYGSSVATGPLAGRSTWTAARP
jgi:ketosteroid isomerase-like protein